VDPRPWTYYSSNFEKALIGRIWDLAGPVTLSGPQAFLAASSRPGK